MGAIEYVISLGCEKKNFKHLKGYIKPKKNPSLKCLFNLFESTNQIQFLPCKVFIIAPEMSISCSFPVYRPSEL